MRLRFVHGEEVWTRVIHSRLKGVTGPEIVNRKDGRGHVVTAVPFRQHYYWIVQHPDSTLAAYAGGELSIKRFSYAEMAEEIAQGVIAMASNLHAGMHIITVKKLKNDHDIPVSPHMLAGRKPGTDGVIISGQVRGTFWVVKHDTPAGPVEACYDSSELELDTSIQTNC